MEIIGHSRELTALEALAHKEHAPHALIFGGPAAIGKKLAARYFFWKLCNPTLPRESFELAATYADVLEVAPEEGAREITVAQIRRVREFVSRSHFSLPVKLVLLD